MIKKKVFIIGNGFDLDLGWRTSFHSFVESDFWPMRHKEPECPMAMFLQSLSQAERWYDLEDALRRYASDKYNHGRADPRDEPFFHELRGALTEYLKQEELSSIKTNSLAAIVLKAVVDNGLFSSIYSFNYTSLDLIASKLGLSLSHGYEHVHGCLEKNSIIIGIDDQSSVRNGYSYLRKVFSEYYSSHQIRYDLQECDEVVFFGHSLGDTDYPYFYDFFREQSRCVSRSDSKHITIFTKDNQSRFQILDQLRTMNGGETEHLQNDNCFKIIMTDAPNEDL